jgi:deoxyribodipyrimidine photo-lyase
MTHTVVWFKKDLRTVDHAPLQQAASHGVVTCVYFIEPSIWRGPDAATQHYLFAIESLRQLKNDLAQLGLRLHIRVGEAVPCLAQIAAEKPMTTLFSHEETGNGLTYARDRAVKRWCQSQGVTWREYRQFGVSRGRHDRDHWKEGWQKSMSAPLVPEVTGATDSGLAHQPLTPPTPAQLGLDPHDPPQRQRGGRLAATQTLQAFLHDRSQQYRGGISSPLSAPTACSRLSVYLTYGCLSMREVFQASRQHIQQLGAAESRQARGLQSFVSRLYWHCHFIQKLEDEPAIEWQNMHRGYNGLRESDWQQAHFEALKAGATGWPMVDACVVMLRETGWLNFRMRAMLVSVAAYPLWLDWRPVGHWLATQFLDYEPGIHWSQMQMQSGTTGINVPRIYNPIKQAQDHDPKGLFVRRWLPALQKVPDAWLFEPWRMPPMLRQTHGLSAEELPNPPVDLTRATRQAKTELFERRKQPLVKAGKAAIVKKHGSRKRLDTPTRQARAKVARDQLTLDF